MSDSPKDIDRDGDSLARLAEAFADLAVPAGPPTAVKERLLVSLAQQSTRPATVRSLRNWKGITMRQALSAAVLLVAATAAAMAWIPRPGSAGDAFADMLEQIREMRSVSFRMSVDLNDAADQFPFTCEMTVIGSDLLRSELNFSGQRAVKIVDFAEQKELLLFPESKRATLRPLKAGSAFQGRNFVQDLQRLKNKYATFVGDDTIDGKLALQYDYQHRGDFYTLWLDAESNLPLRIESANKEEAAEAEVRMTMSNFVWDAPVDETEFSLEAPEGYEMMPASDLQGAPAEE
jgi:hypothetical protein